tara:strand:- start:197 stop:688 length:492 start_codon:yes stop_codon:yes gene_type:complete
MKSPEEQKEYKRQYYLKNRERLLQKQKDYRLNNKESIKSYTQSDNGQKSTKLSCWKKRGLKGDFEEIYQLYITTTHCDLCNKELTMDKKITPTRKCMDHCHQTLEFRNIVCVSCNNTKKEMYKNNTTGHKGIWEVIDCGRIRYRYKSKRFKTLEEAVNYKNNL